MPKLVESVEPEYADAARDARVEGVVTLKLKVDAAGAIAEVEVVDGPGHGLDEAAAAAARRMRFEPARYQGQPVPVTITYRIRFELDDPETLPMLTGSVVGEDGAPVVAAEVTLVDADRTAVTGQDGTFTFPEAPPGRHRLRVRAASYETWEDDVTTDVETSIEVVLKMTPPEGKRYRIVVVARRRREVRRKPVQMDPSPTVSHFELTRRDIELTPGSLEDISRAVQTMPGVVGESGLLATFYVRGGDADEVLFYLDGMPISNAFHLGGFASLFNPELIDRVDFFAGGQPAEYGNSLSGVLDIGYMRGGEDTELVADVSMHTAKARVSGPLPHVEGTTFLLAARRSYFEAYFEAMSAVGIIGDQFAAPDIGEYVAKVTHERGPHTLTFTGMVARDGLHFVGDQDEDVLFAFEGELAIQNVVTLLSGVWETRLRRDLTTRLQLGYLSDSSTTERFGTADSGAAELLNSGDLDLDQLVARASTAWTPGAHELRFGMDFTSRRQRFRGRVVDTRSLPTWAALPAANYHLGTLDIEPAAQQLELAAHVSETFNDMLPGLTPRLGARVDLSSQGEPLLSPRVGLSWAPFAGTVLKLAAGLYYQRTYDPLMLHPEVGNPELKAERSLQTIVGLEQGLPMKTLLRLEAWRKDLSRLIVNPDSPAVVAAGRHFDNSGSGEARGVDALLVHRGDVWGFGATYSYLDTTRDNPLNRVFEQTSPPAQQQTHSFGAAADLHWAKTWVFSARYQFHTGRPYTPISGWTLGTADGEAAWVPVLGQASEELPGRRVVNGSRRDPFHEVSARVERWWREPSWRMTVYAEVVNVANRTVPLIDTFDEGDPAAGEQPRQGSFDSLPIRPFLGARLEL